MTVEDAGRALVAVRRDVGRERSTVEDYESILTQHIVPFFGVRTVDRMGRCHVDAYATGPRRPARRQRCPRRPPGMTG